MGDLALFFVLQSGLGDADALVRRFLLGKRKEKFLDRGGSGGIYVGGDEHLLCDGTGMSGLDSVFGEQHDGGLSGGHSLRRFLPDFVYAPCEKDQTRKRRRSVCVSTRKDGRHSFENMGTSALIPLFNGSGWSLDALAFWV